MSHYHAPEFLRLTSVRTITPNANSIITLSEAKAHLRATGFDDDDSIIADLIDTASEVISKSIGKPLLEATLGVDIHDKTSYKDLYIPVSNLISIEDILIDGVEVDASEYSLILGGDDEFPFVKFKTRKHVTEDISIIFKAGYSPLPKALKQAALLYIGHLYENPNLIAKGTNQQPYELPFTIDVLLAPYYNIGIYGASM